MVHAEAAGASRDDGGPAVRRSEFGRQVRDALRHLYDVPYLHSHPLAQRLLYQPGVRAAALGQMLQRRLVEAIEELRPGSEAPGTESAQRRYVLLKLRYVEARELPEIREQLAISQSQFYRELDPGLEAIVARLMEELPEARPVAVPQPPRAAPPEKAAAAAPLAASLADPPRLRTPLVGRSAELERLQVAYEAAARGEGGRLFLLAGETGVGKTRLVQEAGIHARAQGGLFLEGRYLWGANTPYGAWVEALRPGLRALARQDLAGSLGPYATEISRLFPELAELFEPLPQPGSLGEEEQRLRLFDGVAELLRHLSQRVPTLLFLDDLHWASQMALLVHVARRLDGYRVLVVGAYREQDFSEQPTLVRARAELHRARLFTPMTLSHLCEEDPARLLADAFDDDVAARLGEAVYSRTHGNPFFVEEVLRSLVERGAVRPSDGGWEVLDQSLVAVPESVKLAVAERVARLGERTAEILAQAAVLGQEFSLPALAHTTDLPEEELTREVERAVSAGLLADRSVLAQERYGFRDDQVHEVLYASTFAPRRQRYHRRAGRAIETLHAADLEPHLEALALHFTQGHEPEKAAHYSYRAGEKARRLFVWARCLDLYRTALELYEELGGHAEERAAACERLGDVSYKSAIEAPRGVGYFQQALALYEQLGNRHRVATIHSQLGREHISSANLGVRDQVKALEHFHLARRILEGGRASRWDWCIAAWPLPISTFSSGPRPSPGRAAPCGWASGWTVRPSSPTPAPPWGRLSPAWERLPRGPRPWNGGGRSPGRTDWASWPISTARAAPACAVSR